MTLCSREFSIGHSYSDVGDSVRHIAVSVRRHAVGGPGELMSQLYILSIDVCDEEAERNLPEGDFSSGGQ